MEYYERIFCKKIILNYKEVFSIISDNILSKMLINLIYFLDYCSIYKSIMFGIDPSPVTSIDFIKKQL